MDRFRIIAIEDDDGVCRLLRHSLAREDFDLQIVATGKDGLAATRKMIPDLVLLDLGLPDMDGLKVCRNLKSRPETRHLPVIILTGKGEESDVVSGLEMGADDYIVKPFRPRILNARIRAVLRRQTETTNTLTDREDLKLGRLTIFPQQEVVTLADESIDLNPSEFHFIHSLTRCLCEPGLSTSDSNALGHEGMALYAENRLDRLLPIFDEFLATCSQQNPLLLKFSGLSLLHIDTKRSVELLYQSLSIFSKTDNPVAELSVLSHLILVHVFLDGDVDKATVLFQKAEQLANPHFDQLSVFSRISVAQALAVGYALLGNNFGRAYEYLSIAEALAEDRGLENFRVINLLVHAYEAYISADIDRLAHTIDETLLLLNHPQISPANKALLKLAQLVYISLTGEFSYFHTVEQSMRDEFEALLPATSFPSCLLTLLQAQAAQAEGDHSKVMSVQSSALINRLHQPILAGIQALSAALSNQSQIATDAVTACLNFNVPVSFVDMQGRLYCIRALLTLDQTAEAAKLLEQTQTDPKITNWPAIETQALALSLLFHRDRPMTSQPVDSLQKLLHKLKVTGIRHLRCLTREDLHYILTTAVMQNIERPFATELCRSILQLDWTRSGEPVPILHFNTLGGLQLSSEERSLLGIDGFSRSQRECLALLIATPKNRIDQEEMQLTFWPESRPDKARANLDTMLSRLRKTVQARIKPLTTKNYLKLQKGVVSLDHCTFDTDELLIEINRGRNFLHKREFWRADIALSRALSLWGGDFVPGACITNQTTEFARKIRQSCIEATLSWGEALNDLGQTPRAIKVFNRALSLDQCNENIISALYRSYMRSKNIAKAGLLLRQYEKSLLKEDYSSTETVRLLTSIRSLSAK